MIEVLVALLVLAIGLLGVAGVQLLSMQQTANSTLRSETCRLKTKPPSYGYLNAL